MIFATSFILFVIYAAGITFTTSVLVLPVEVGMMVLYVLVSFLVLLPLPGIDARNAFFRLTRSVLFPSNSISFPEVLLADALTSLSKIFKDFCITGLVLYCYVTNENIISYHNVGIVLIALLSSFPYW